MKPVKIILKILRIYVAVFLLLLASDASAQFKGYIIKDGRMFIELSRNMKESALDSFITQFELQELDLKTFFKTSRPDSLMKLGWNINLNNETGFIISKPFEPFNLNNVFAGKVIFNEKNKPGSASMSHDVTFGVNRFRNRLPFAKKDSKITFFLPNNQNAKKVMLAGNFNDWSPDNLSMHKTDSGWIADIKLGPGKYWYKFIVDGNWSIDNDNLLRENDGQGNINSVYFNPNVLITLEGFENAKKVFLAGSFNNWKKKDLVLTKLNGVWQLPLYLAKGTHTYKFIIDGEWYADPKREKLPDGQGGYNSVIRLGNPYVFKLNGFTGAKKVMLAGSFNGWRENELQMNKTATGWELLYTLGAGNYEYKFIVDGKWITDPANAMSSANSGNSFLIIEPNHSFRLKGFANAKKVFLAGDFNSWDPNAYSMRREGDDWIFSVHLSPGKHLYKFIVDGKWMLDPGNKLWEQNEYGNDNSIIWIGQNAQ